MKFIENILNRKLEKQRKENEEFLKGLFPMRQKCRSLVIDLWTGRLLVCCEKERFFSGSENFGLIPKFKTVDGDIYGLFREVTVKGRPCVIIYYIGLKKICPGSRVTLSGCLVGLNGSYFDHDYKDFYPLKLGRKTLRSIGYKRKLLKRKRVGRYEFSLKYGG